MSVTAEIQTAYATDVPGIMRVMEAAFDPIYGEAWNSAQLMTLFVLPGSRMAYAHVDKEICGFYAARVAGPETELLLIAVHPQHRSSGIGRLLMDDWQAWANSKGVEDYFLEMRADNPAISMYNAAGFFECGRRPAYYSGGDGKIRDAITMRRNVSV
jgi:[ribosomal protein S18]-alanine N-acetyltransferase